MIEEAARGLQLDSVKLGVGLWASACGLPMLRKGASTRAASEVKSASSAWELAWRVCELTNSKARGTVFLSERGCGPPVGALQLQHRPARISLPPEAEGVIDALCDAEDCSSECHSNADVLA